MFSETNEFFQIKEFFMENWIFWFFPKIWKSVVEDQNVPTKTTPPF